MKCKDCDNVATRIAIYKCWKTGEKISIPLCDKCRIYNRRHMTFLRIEEL